MYLLAVRAVWNEEGDPVIAYRSYTRMKEWRYTEKDGLLMNCVYRNRRKYQKLWMEVV
mgnify:FL=1